MSNFVETDRENNPKFVEFRKNNPRVIEMLFEIKERIPWQRELVNSLIEQIKFKGRLTDKQKSLVTSVYADSCMKSDKDIELQVEYRKLIFRLLETRLGKVKVFVNSVMLNTTTKPLSLLQMRAIRNVAEKNKVELANIAELNESNFDGWNKRFG